MVKLTKLQLDNNIIEKIDNIGHLKRLKWLDLSFNCIQKIENLDQLTELEDLSLFSNEITKVENLDNCTKLNVLSLGNNKIDNLEDLYTYLAPFKKLEVLSVGGNPFTKKEAEYRLYLIFYIESLKYLDYSFIDKPMRDQIREEEKLKNAADARALKAKDNIIKEEEDRLKKMFQEECKAARVDVLDNLPKEIRADQDLSRLVKVKGVKVELDSMIENFRETTEELQKEITKKNAKKVVRINQFKTEYYAKIKD